MALDEDTLTEPQEALSERQAELMKKSENMAREHSARRKQSKDGKHAKSVKPTERSDKKERRSKRERSPSRGKRERADDTETEEDFTPLEKLRAGGRRPPQGQVGEVQGARIPSQEQRSSVDALAVELESWLADVRMGWRRFHLSDKITAVAAVLTLAGVFMPWVSTPSMTHEPGLFAGGVLHAALSVTALALIVRRASLGHGPEAIQKARRHSLFHVLLGALSTFLGVAVLVFWGLKKSAAFPVDIHFGLYWTVACGTGLSYGGFARFVRWDGEIDDT